MLSNAIFPGATLKPLRLFSTNEAHNVLHAGAVVPAAVKDMISPAAGKSKTVVNECRRTALNTLHCGGFETEWTIRAIADIVRRAI